MAWQVDKGVSHRSLPIFAHYVMRRSRPLAHMGRNIRSGTRLEHRIDVERDTLPHETKCLYGSTSHIGNRVGQRRNDWFHRSTKRRFPKGIEHIFPYCSILVMNDLKKRFEWDLVPKPLDQGQTGMRRGCAHFWLRVLKR